MANWNFNGQYSRMELPWSIGCMSKFGHILTAATNKNGIAQNLKPTHGSSWSIILVSLGLNHLNIFPLVCHHLKSQIKRNVSRQSHLGGLYRCGKSHCKVGSLSHSVVSCFCCTHPFSACNSRISAVKKYYRNLNKC